MKNVQTPGERKYVQYPRCTPWQSLYVTSASIASDGLCCQSCALFRKVCTSRSHY